MNFDSFFYLLEKLLVVLQVGNISLYQLIQYKEVLLWYSWVNYVVCQLSETINPSLRTCKVHIQRLCVPHQPLIERLEIEP